MKRMVVLCFLLFILFVGTSYAQQKTPTEYQVKAAFLYNFANFIDWPSETFTDTKDQLIIGILGEDPFGDDIDKVVEGKIVKGKKLIIRRFLNLEDISECHILFICASEKKRLKQILEIVKGTNVLTVGDTDNFAQNGVMVNFFVRNKKIRFEINITTVEEAGFTVSSQLLRLATLVQE